MRRKGKEYRSPQEILAEAERLLGPAVKVEWHRRWAIFWCPFHDDISKQGKRGRPNFGVNLDDGYWKCLRCGASGPSLRVLEKKLGKWTPPPVPERPKEPPRPSFSLLAEAVAVARANFRGSPAEQYLAAERKIRPAVAAMYGMGYGVPFPPVSQSTLRAAQAHRLATDKGWWIWAGGLVYAEPPMEPVMIQVRHLREKAYSKYQTWGRLKRPAGAWRVSASTEVLVIVEGMVDMLALAQTFQDHRLGASVIPLYIAGSGSTDIYRWLREKGEKREVFLIPDPDEGGKDWLANLRRHGVKGEVFWPPNGLDPDEAVLAGWWPFPF